VYFRPVPIAYSVFSPVSETLCTMQVQLSISPAGRLLCDLDSTADAPWSECRFDEALAASLSDAFGKSSGSGLLRLSEVPPNTQLPMPFVFWRTWCRRVLQSISRMPEDSFAACEQWVRTRPKSSNSAPPDAPEPPADDELTAIIEAAPPMRGLEYLTPALLKSLWQQSFEEVLQQAQKAKLSCRELLQQLNPDLHLLGKVTFHLAENKRDPERPFAFLATWAHRLSTRAQLQHLPLAEALRHYASEKDQQTLAELLSPVREAAARSNLVDQLLTSRAIFRPQAWTADQAHAFLNDIPQMEQSGLIVRVPDWWSGRRAARPVVQIRIGESGPARVGLDVLLDFSMELAIDGSPLTAEEQRRLLAAGEGLHLLRGKWVEVDPEKLQQVLQQWKQLKQQHADGITLLQGLRLLAGTRPDGSAEAPTSQEGWAGVVTGTWMTETLQALRNPGSTVDCEPGQGLAATLRPYQTHGVRWLWQMLQLGLGACLADDMGLGKTIQVIDLMLRLRAAAVDATPPKGRPSRGKTAANSATAPFLLVVPASLLGNWKQELAKFAPQLRVLVAHRSECSVDTLQELERTPVAVLDRFDVVITTYQALRRAEWPFGVRWRLCVLDEAQAIRNAGSSQSKAVRRLQSASRIILTGTPVENQLGDLWPLFDFCNPGLLGSLKQFEDFVKRISRSQNTSAAASLRKLVRPCILRRMKTDPGIIPDLPDKTEITVQCGLSAKQAAYYQQIIDDVAKQLKNADGIKRRGLILSMLMRLKQLCNHPSLLLGQPDFSPADSGKFLLLQNLCEPIAARQEKVLVFTQFQTQCDSLAEFLATVFRRRGLVLHGQVPVAKRKHLVSEFQEGDDVAFFVISVKAGGTGLNLTAASHVIHFDRWWNPAVENQATDRAFRIGQKRNVLVQKFVCRGTLEERIDQVLREKQTLANDILGDGSETLLTEMSDRELMDFVALDLSRASVED
jgi:non-specific serine/threonine protein kinase